ncbi:tetratricopeptide repeat protein [Alkalinema sp. FACHB-956]|uniref:tetratricopeptide repeat protein n=1 Tax=Alkalinema sp. FACHB-956 TaxID=2692768 RepID=UPI001689D64E|nr:tetratricopeptide repeat protein [Alkalinema sp. FACHB-956]
MYKRIALLFTILLLNSGIARRPAIAYLVPHLPHLDDRQLEREGNDLLGESIQLAQLQQFDLAITRAKLATQLIPKNPDVWSVLGGLYLADNKTDLSIAALQKAKALEPKESAIWFRLGNAYFQKKDYPKAIESLQSGLALKPNVPGALFDLGNAYLMSGKKNEAIATYEKAYAQDKKFWYPLNNIGLIKYEIGDVKEAIRLWKLSVAAATDSTGAEPKLALAVATYQTGDQDQGLKLGEAAVKLDSRYSDIKFLKENLWGDRLIAATQEFLELPRIKAAISQSKSTESEGRSPR